jgi:hypothetical protein
MYVCAGRCGKRLVHGRSTNVGRVVFPRRGAAVGGRPLNESLGRMITITDGAIALLQTGHARANHMVHLLEIIWITEASIKRQIERFGDKFGRPSESERWLLHIAGYKIESQLASDCVWVAPAVYLRMKAKAGESPPFPGGTIDVADGKLVLDLHAT